MFLLYNTWTHKLLHLHKSGALRIFAYSLLRFRRMQTKLDQESVSLEDIYIVSCLQGVELCLLCKSISWARENEREWGGDPEHQQWLSHSASDAEHRRSQWKHTNTNNTTTTSSSSTASPARDGRQTSPWPQWRSRQRPAGALNNIGRL